MSANVWLGVGIVVLIFVLVGLSIGIGILSFKNIKTFNDQLIYPFVGYLGAGKVLSRHDGTNQITCPVGKQVRILGAYFDVYDPYLECASSPDQTASTAFVKNCQDIVSNNPGFTFSCTSAQGCTCNSNGCVVGQGQPKAACECAHTDPSKGFQNCACSNYQGTNQYNCKGRDASAYLAKVCNGQNSCSVSLDTNGTDEQLTSQFGPYPCNLSPIQSSDAQGYSMLPMVRGNDGLYGDKPSAMKQGYYVHGLFTCE